ncbi:PASTA domain-containing protein [Candidatus Cardinium hertigii]|uniref:PASTA domain-containing protein n=1 Tax=Candidatus Cardinium hertigii TaxID=247481 RepID=UPI003D7D5BDF
MFFYIALPYITRQGKLVQVPDLTGMPLEALDGALSKYDLRYIITDNSSYAAELPPFTVLQQFPAAGAWVKTKRKIYLTLNAENPPLVSMPHLIEGSIRQAQLLLKNKGLKLGKIKYVPDITKYAVLEQWHDQHPIPTGKSIHKGSTIDLVVGAGLGEQIIEVPDVIAMPLEEAHVTLLERGMRIGVVHHLKKSDAPIGSVIQQNPMPATKVPLGTSINLWIVQL